MYSVRIINRFIESPRQFNLQVTKRIFRYIRGTIEDGIFYSTRKDFQMGGYIESDWESDIGKRKSTMPFIWD